MLLIWDILEIILKLMMDLYIPQPFTLINLFSIQRAADHALFSRTPIANAAILSSSENHILEMDNFLNRTFVFEKSFHFHERKIIALEKGLLQLKGCSHRRIRQVAEHFELWSCFSLEIIIILRGKLDVEVG